MKSILFLVPHPVDCSDYRYRAAQFFPYLERAGYSCTIWPFSTRTLHSALGSKGRLAIKTTHMLFCTFRRLLELARVSQFDFVVINREVFPFFTPLMERFALWANSKIIFSFDDAIYVGHQDISKLNHSWLYRFKYGKGVDEVLCRSFHVIAGNRILAEYARRFTTRVTVIPTVVDCTQYCGRMTARREGKTLTIGWIGSRSTFNYLYNIESALRRLAEKHGDLVQFSGFGYAGFTLNVPGFKALPFSLDREVDYLGSIDIGLMPLPDTEWTRGKCAFKAIQYMAMGIPTVASPVGITTDLIEDGVNGLLADTPEQWFQAMDRIVKDEGLRSRVSAAARYTIEKNYSLQVWGPRLVSLFDSFSDRSRSCDLPLALVSRS